MIFFSLIFVQIIKFSSAKSSTTSIDTCGRFDSHMGATFDVSELTRNSDQPAYEVTDGDLPCTKKCGAKLHLHVQCMWNSVG